MTNIPDFIVHLQSCQPLVLLLYAGPDQILPLLSIIGAIIGFLLMWWQRFTQLVRRAWQAAFKRSPTSAKK